MHENEALLREPQAWARSLSSCEATLVFCDIAEFTRLTRNFGDLTSYRMVKGCQGLVSAAVRRSGGEVLEIRGDGFLFAFPHPDAAARCAVQIQRAVEERADPLVRMRIGMHTGCVIRDGERYYGRNMILAFRVSAMAEPGEILVSEATRRVLTPDRFRLGRSRLLQLKGFDDPERVWSLSWSRMRRSDHNAPANPLPLVRTARVGPSGLAEAGAVGDRH